MKLIRALLRSTAVCLLVVVTAAFLPPPGGIQIGGAGTVLPSSWIISSQRRIDSNRSHLWSNMNGPELELTEGLSFRKVRSWTSGDCLHDRTLSKLHLR